MNLGDFFQGVARKVPGQSWLSSTRLGDILGGGSWRALERNDWRFPVGHDTTSFDDLAGAGASSSVGLRNLARGVGALFGGGALYSALGGGSAAAGEAGGGGAGGSIGPGGLEGGGVGPAAGEGATDASGPGWQDYLRRYGRQGMNLLSNMGGSGGTGAAMPQDNSMIEPLKVADPFADYRSQGISPEILAMLLNPRWADQAGEQSNGPYINSGGLA